ncbi:transmembrane amino acid transporter protein-domain-containing protein [Pelagophyceae sp. CCMP2097]|nr:transmembrane amino acid transporter protein-domain-containing protein [Pelagophyceae sp. CCMP2097]
MIIGDAFAALIATAKPSPQVLAALGLLGGTRKACISLVSALALFPLCSLKSLKALAPTSALGTAGVVYTTIFMIIRALDGSYAPGGKFAMALAAAGGVAPKFGAGIMARPARLGVFVAMLGTAFMAHFNAPSFYTEAIKLSTFSKLVTRGFGFSVLLNVLIMVAGFGTFGAACNGLVLNNYATTDTLAGLARALFGVSIVFTFPLAFAGSKAGMREVLGKVLPKKSEALETAVVALPLALITAVALVLDDVGAVVSLTGALMGSAIIYILPAIMLLKGEKLDRSPLEKRAVPYAMMLLGAVSATLGVYTTLA